jgi:hypothetical protein
MNDLDQNTAKQDWKDLFIITLQGICTGTLLAILRPDLVGLEWWVAALSILVLVNSNRLKS